LKKVKNAINYYELLHDGCTQLDIEQKIHAIKDNLKWSDWLIEETKGSKLQQKKEVSNNIRVFLL
jgi:hypothetical protein